MALRDDAGADRAARGPIRRRPRARKVSIATGAPATATPMTPPGSGQPLRVRLAHIDPRYLVAFLITLVLLAAQLRYHMIGGYERLATALLTCVAAEALLSWFVRGKVVNLQSAYISGISLTLLTKPQGAVLWPFIV